MEVIIRSTRGNVNYTISSKGSISYDYTNPNGKSADLDIIIKGGSRSAYGNAIQRRTSGRERVTYTTGANFNSPLSNVDSSTGYSPSSGISFIVRQLEFPNLGENTSTIFSLIENPPPPPSDPGPPVPYTPYPAIVFGSTPYATENDVCAYSGVNAKEKTYYKLKGYLYNTVQDAQSDIKAVFPNTKNYILTSITSYLIVNFEGYIESVGQTCVLPQVTISTLRGNYPTQEEACARSKALVSAGNTTYEYKDNRLVNRVSGFVASTSLSGRYPIAINGRGGQNIILSSGKIVGYETCGTELTDVTYGAVGWSNSSYPLGDPENGNPRNIQLACNNNDLITYSLGPSGVVYYGFNYKDGQYKYVPLGLGTRWHKTTDGTFVNFDRGLIVDTADPC
jgi:hypothetical protein